MRSTIHHQLTTKRFSLCLSTSCKLIIFLICGLYNSLSINGQTVYIGTGTSGTSSYPIYTFYNYSATECVYLTTEIGSDNRGKNITKVGYYKTSGASTTPIAVKIYMKTIPQTGVNNATSSSSSYTIGSGFDNYTLVYDGNLPNNTTSGLLEVSLSTPFYYDSGNLSVLITSNTYISSGRPSFRYNSTGTPYKRSSYTSDTNVWSPNVAMNPGSDRPHIQLTFEDAASCSGVPVPGNTISSSSNVCSNENFTLSLQNTILGSGITYQWQYSTDGNSWINITGANNNTLVNTQLTSTYYRCLVTCSNNSDTSNPVLINTEQQYASLPFAENFESWQNKCGGTLNVPSTYWLNLPATGNNSWRRNDQGGTAAWGSESYGAYSPVSQNGSYSARFHSTYAANGQQGSLDLHINCSTGSNNKRITFYYINTNGSDKLEVLISTNGGTTFTKIGNTITTTTSWSLQTHDFVSSSAQTIIRLTATSDYGTTDIGIDSLSIDDVPSCLPPTTVLANNITSNTATITWTAPFPIPPNGYEYYFTSSQFVPTMETTPMGTAFNDLNLEFLAPNTTYYVWLRSVCSGNEKSAWSSVTNFTTKCAAANLPYSLNFDTVNAPVLPSCITVENTNADGSAYTWKTSGSQKSSAPNAMYLNSTYNSNNDYFFTEGLNIVAGNTYKLTFKYLIGYSYSYRADLTVTYGTQPISSGDSIELVSLVNLQGSSGNTTFNTYEVSFSPIVSGIYYIGFRGQNQAEIYIDDISVVQVPDCTAITFPSSITSTASKTIICSEETIDLDIVGTLPLATGITYQWEYSQDNINYTSIGNAEALSKITVTANTAAKWFRCIVLCNNQPIMTAAAVEIYIETEVLDVFSNSSCNAGTVILEATARTGNTLNWYAAAEGGSILGTGASFTTPVISETTTFYVAASGGTISENTGPVSPQAVSSVYGNTNNGDGVIFDVTKQITLSSVTIYPIDGVSGNRIYIIDASGTELYSLTFSTIGVQSLSTTTNVGAPFVVNLNWNIPAGTNYKLMWAVPDYYGNHRILRNTTGAIALYDVNNNGVTFTGNTSGGKNYWFNFYNWIITTTCEGNIRIPVTAQIKEKRWGGQVNGNWNNAANWHPFGVPSASDCVVIPSATNNPICDESNTAYAKTLILLENASLLLKTGSTIEIIDEINIHPNANFTLENDAYLLQSNSTNTNNNEGNITVLRKSAPMFRLEATGWSSPVINQKLYDFAVGTVSERIYQYDEPTNSFSNTGINTISEFVPGKGYSIRAPNHYPAYSDTAIPVSFQGVFYGKPNNGTIEINVTKSNLGYNYVGNPYPSPVDAATFLSENPNINALYFWTHESPPVNGAYMANNYASFNRIGGTKATAGGREPDGIIQVGQGFIVKTTQENTLQFTNSMRLKQSNGQFFRESRNNAEKHRIWLNLSDATRSYNQILIGYVPESSAGVNHDLNAKMFDYNGSAIYSLIDNEKLVIQGRNLPFESGDTVPLGFKALHQGIFSISIDKADGIFEQEQAVYIKDLDLHIVHHLNQSDYTFFSETGEYNNRFQIVYTDNVLNIDQPEFNNNWIAYKNDNEIKIQTTGFDIHTITVYDLTGRLLFSKQNINNSVFSCPIAVPEQILLVRINNALVKKIK